MYHNLSYMKLSSSFALGVYDGFHRARRRNHGFGFDRTAYLEGYEYGLVAELAEAQAVDAGIDDEAERSRA